jgi:ElaB/YqjD/DUF883 family membrane-anchored ribosome-binding protein
MSAARTADENDAASQFADDMAKLKAEMAELTKLLSKTGKDGVGAAGEAASESVSKLRAKGGEVLDRLGEGAHSVEDRIASYVKEKPFTSLAIAAGVGCLAAALLRRR